MINISCVSLNQVWLDKKENIRQVDYYAGLASTRKSDVVVFPEMTATGFSMNAEEIAEDINCSDTIASLSEIACKYKIWIVAGLATKLEARIYNSAIVISSSGDLVTKYDKIHPFSFASEDQYYSAGTSLNAFALNGVNIGLSICYDLRFPEVFSGVSQEADIVINIANWPDKRVSHWYALLRARSIENQIFMVGVNRLGTDGNGLVYSRSTKIYGADGDQVAPLESNGALDVFQLSIKELDSFRESFPTRKDRRPYLYKDFIRSEYEKNRSSAEQK